MNNKLDMSFVGYKGYLFMNIDEYNDMIRSINMKSLVGIKMNIEGDFIPIKSKSNPGVTSPVYTYLSNKSLGKIEVDSMSLTLNKNESVGNLMLSQVFEKNKIRLYSLRKLLNNLNHASLVIKHEILIFREKILSNLTNQVNLLFEGNTSGLLLAMYIGEKEQITSELNENFQIVGVSHIIAISGLHIGLLYLMIHLCISFFIKNLKLKFFVIALILVMYNFLIGHNVSSLRATMMVLIYLFSVYFYKYYQKSKSLFLCASLYLICYPEGIFKGGFLLSYGAVIGLFYIYPLLRFQLSSWLLITSPFSIKTILLDLALISISVNIVTFPILIKLFKGISLISVIANILMVPVVFSFYVTGIVSLLTSIVLPYIGLFIAGSVEIIVNYMLAVSSILSNLSWAYIHIRSPHLLIIIIYYILLYQIVVSYHNNMDGNEMEGNDNESIKQNFNEE